jgi:hypothetical protein
LDFGLWIVDFGLWILDCSARPSSARPGFFNVPTAEGPSPSDLLYL